MKRKAKYMVIYDWLSERIADKTYQPGDRIPNECDLAAMFGVHRMTVRQATNKLVGEHILVRKPSKGTFLLSEKSPVLTRMLANITTYHDDIAAAGLEPQYKTIDARIVPCPEELAPRLGLAPGDPTVYLSRLMLASKVPLVLERGHLPADVFPGIVDMDLNTGLYFIMSHQYSITPKRSYQEIEAVMPTPAEQKLLKIGDRCPCLLVRTEVQDDQGRTVEVSSALHRGDKYRFRCAIGQYLCEDIAPSI